MLRTASKWTLQVRKPVTKKSIGHWVWLGSARRAPLANSVEEGARARELSVDARKDLQ